MILKYIKKENDQYEVLRQVLKQELKISSKLMLKLKRNNSIFVNNENAYLDKKINTGDIITVHINFEEDSSNIVPTKMDINILYEDEYLLIVDKPAGIAIHPSILHYDTSLSNGIKYYFDHINLKRKIRPVNRLDRDTSGIVIFAKNEYIQELLSKQMKDNIFEKYYIAICEGSFEKEKGIIDLPIARKENSIIERCVSENGDSAITKYEVINRFGSTASELMIKLETGRTHQIRVHMAYVGHPIIGDTLYGNKSNLIKRQALHAYKIKFIHPVTKIKKEVISPLPQDINKLKANL